ncbi:MAG: hypothetical protein KF780_03495 [Sphingomonas sp.]|nr:hypothetical protein [Sphingomonas sp.]
MTIVDTTKFAIGILFAVIGVGVLVVSRREGGFGQRRQAGVLMLVAAALFGVAGLGLVEF